MKSLLNIGLASALVCAGLTPAFAEDGSFDLSEIQTAADHIAADAGQGVAPDTAFKPQAKASPFAAGVERRIVVFHDGVAQSSMRNLIAANGGTVTHDLWLINAVAVEMPAVSQAGFDRALQAAADVKRVDLDRVQQWVRSEGGPQTSAECPPWWPPGLPGCDPPGGGGDDKQTVPWGIERVNAPAAWAASRGAGVKVAVVDTGVDPNHKDLRVSAAFSAFENEGPEDGNGHGTHVAGTIAGLDNGIGVVGVAPDVTLIAAKVLDSGGSGTYATVIAGLQWAVEQEADVVNMSLGGDQGEPSLEEAFQAAADAGVVIVAAAGNNSGAVGYPAKYPSTIAIAASDSSDKAAYFSSRGPEVEFITPGVQVYSTYKGGGYRKLDGTSMACPHAAGLAALAVASGAHGIDAVRAALKAAATKLPGVPDTLNGSGLPDAARIVGSGI